MAKLHLTDVPYLRGGKPSAMSISVDGDGLVTGTIEFDDMHLNFKSGVLSRVAWATNTLGAAYNRYDVRTAMVDAEAHRSCLYTAKSLWDTYGPPEETPAEPLDADAPRADADAGEEEG